MLIHIKEVSDHMETNEQIRQLVLANIYSYVALVNSLKASGALDEAALLARLDRWSQRQQEQNILLVAEILRGLHSALSTNPPDVQALEKLLH